MPGLKTLAVVVTVKGGARWEPLDRSGWSHLLEHLVFKGAGDMAAREIVERIEAEGGTINASTGYERTSFEVRGLDGSLPLAMQVLSDLVFRPTLDPAEIEREKDVVAQEIALRLPRTLELILAGTLLLMPAHSFVPVLAAQFLAEVEDHRPRFADTLLL